MSDGPLEECRAHGVPNLRFVRNNVYRSGQPTVEGWDYLRTLFDGKRVRVLKLNFDDEGSDEPARAMGWDVRELGIEPRTDPNGLIPAVEEVFEKPDPSVWAEIEQQILLMDTTGETYLIHCVNGHDRTGLACGHVRVLLDKWTKALAYSEMVALGFHPELVGLDRQWADLRAPGGSTDG